MRLVNRLMGGFLMFIGAGIVALLVYEYAYYFYKLIILLSGMFSVFLGYVIASSED